MSCHPKDMTADGSVIVFFYEQRGLLRFAKCCLAVSQWQQGDRRARTESWGNAHLVV
jgi:hypothetical protein